MKRFYRLVALSWLASGTARAQDNFDLFTVDSRAAAMGGAMTATSDGFSSTYYGPANLAFCTGSSVSVQGSYMISDLTSTVPQGATPGWDPTDRLGLTLGGCMRLPHRLAIGLAIDAAADNLLGVRVSTPNPTPRWFNYGGAQRLPTIQAAAAWAILDNLSVGVGVSATLNLGIGLAAGLPVFEDGTVQVEMSTEATPVVGAIASVAYRPGPMKIGLTYRQAHYVAIDASLPISIDSGSELAIVDLRLVDGYRPHQVALGVSGDPIPDLTIAADVTWHHWRGYTGPDGGFGPYAQVTAGDTETLPDEANAADLLSYATASVVFNDVFSPRIGVEYRFKDMLSFRGGYHYRPTPYAAPEGETNLLDGDQHTASLGVGYRHLLGKKGVARADRRQRIDLDLHGRVGIMGNTTFLQPEQATYQEISWGGNVYDVGLTATYAWR